MRGKERSGGITPKLKTPTYLFGTGMKTVHKTTAYKYNFKEKNYKAYSEVCHLHHQLLLPASSSSPAILWLPLLFYNLLL